MSARFQDFNIPPTEGLPEAVRQTLNNRFDRIAEALELQSGLRGEVTLKADLNLNGNRIVNGGAPLDPGDFVTYGHAESNYGGKVIKDILDDLADFTTDRGDDVFVDTDTVAPTNLPVPILRYKRGKFDCWLNPQGADLTGIRGLNTLRYVYLCITNGTNSIHLADLDQLTPVVGVVFYRMDRTKLRQHVPMSRDQVRTLLGATGTCYCIFKLENNINTTQSANSNSLDLETLKDYSPRTGGNANELWNGDFTFSDTVTSTTLGNWLGYIPSDNSGSSPFQAITTTTNSLRWLNTSQLAFFRKNSTGTNKRYLVQPFFKTMVRLDYHSLSLFLSSDSSLTADLDIFFGRLFRLTGTWDTSNASDEVSVNSGGSTTDELKVGAEVGDGNETRTVIEIESGTKFRVNAAWSALSNNITLRGSVPQSDIVPIPAMLFNTTPTYVELTLQLNDDMVTTDDIYLCLRTSTEIATTGPFLQIQRVMQVPGQTPVQFARKVLYERNTKVAGVDAGGVPVASENFTTVPTTTIGGRRQEPSGEPPGSGNYQLPA
jgi:hypothetical protein